MKILAHSLVPVNPLPYQHLGYLSATTNAMDKPTPAYYGAAGMLLIGVILVFRFQRTSWRWSTLGGIVAIVGLFSCLGIARNGGPLRYQHPHHAMDTMMESYTRQAAELHQTGEPLPSGLSTFIVYDREHTDVQLDAWFRPFWSFAAGEGENAVMIIVSAGQDGKFGTADDVVGAYGANVTALRAFLTETTFHTATNEDAIGRTALVGLQRALDNAHQAGMPDEAPICMYSRGATHFTIISAGPDKRHGTEDDVKIPAS